MTDKLLISTAQFDPTVGDVVSNTIKIMEGWHKAKATSADLYITTEHSLLGYPPEDLVKKPDVLLECQDAVQYIAKATRDGPPLLIAGPIEENGIIYNAAFYIGGGKVLKVIKKHDLPNYGVFDDKRVFGAGQDQEPILVKGVPVGVLICEDTWFPEVAENLVKKGAKILASMNASPYECDKEISSRMDVLFARTIETGLPMIYVNQVGGQDGVVFDGHSLALNADRSIAWKAPGWVEHQGLVTCEKRGEEWLLTGEHTTWGEGLEQAYSAIVLGTRDYIQKNGFKKVVIGLSGGADSALVAAIAVDAIGAENVNCVRLPSEFTSPASMDDAEEIAQILGCNLGTISIAEIAAAAGKTLTEYFGEPSSDLTAQNLQARARGLLLMAITNQHPHHLLLTTGNKSEMCVGYATLYGDMSGGFNPLKDVYKTTVFSMMEWRNHHKPAIGLGPTGLVIPQNIITKPPSAELKAGQTDENELGSYATLDAVLTELIERETPIVQIIAKGYDAEYVMKISDMVDRAEHKRRQAPPGVKLTSRALFGDRRYPITNGFRSSHRVRADFAARLNASAPRR